MRYVGLGLLSICGVLCATAADNKMDAMQVAPNGQPPAERHSKLGDVRWISATSHMGENPGTTEMRGLIVELKEPKPKFQIRRHVDCRD